MQQQLQHQQDSSVPNYLAGFIYGMSGVDHQDELAHCFHPIMTNRPRSIAEDAHLAMLDI